MRPLIKLLNNLTVYKKKTQNETYTYECKIEIDVSLTFQCNAQMMFTP